MGKWPLGKVGFIIIYLAGSEQPAKLADRSWTGRQSHRDPVPGSHSPTPNLAEGSQLMIAVGSGSPVNGAGLPPAGSHHPADLEHQFGPAPPPSLEPDHQKRQSRPLT